MNLYESDNNNVTNLLDIWKSNFPGYYFRIDALSYDFDKINLIIPVIMGVNTDHKFHFAFLFDNFSKDYTSSVITYVKQSRYNRTAPSNLINKSLFDQLKSFLAYRKKITFSKQVYIFTKQMTCSKKKITAIFKKEGFLVEFR